ncbi:Serine/threonine-protein kinase PknB [Planctomycetales bacterium 10988]|nr:Serine/threonine-protein kinase PknB [Planctomycetales bacterium 10988]
MAIGSEKSIFLQSLDFESPSERAAFVQQACEGDNHLLDAVVALLREHDRLENPIDRPLASSYLPTLFQGGGSLGVQTSFVPGTMVDSYKLMEQIGEGGFGLVFVADQLQPVRRRVALKIIKPGMESREVIARFEAERQALAMMDHENIARVFDAGVTETGQPYFVMELVRGVPLNKFCDQQQLTTQQRLQLFLSICHAVHHAHQKGIIHRDLKPSNVLVTLQDGQPLAKVIDFGILKAIGQNLTDMTIYTQFASMMGTPAYMSPEQAEMSNDDIDTRSDIYSLGVLLYELLTGSTPFTLERLNRVSFDEMRRIIREEEPPRPSTRLNTLENQLASTVSMHRQLAPAKLSSLLAGDLDWIVMKSLEKDRNRRYPSAAAFAKDITRYLNEQPIEARPPSASYRLSKFARRNKVAFIAVSLVAAALILGTAISVWQASVAYDALKQAQVAESKANQSRQELEDFTERLKEANLLLTSGRAFVEAGDWADAHEAYRRATEVQPRYFHVWLERGSLYAKLGLWEEAVQDYRKALELGCPVNGAEFLGVPQVFYFAGSPQEYQRISTTLLGSDNGYLGTEVRGVMIGKLSQNQASALVTRAEKLFQDHPSHAKGPTRISRMPHGAKLYIAGWAHLEAGNYEQAIKRLHQSHEEDPSWPGNGISYPLLAIAYQKTGQLSEAAEALAQSEKSLHHWLEESLEKEQGMPPIPWFDWIEFLVHHREASLLLTGVPPTLDPRLAEQQVLARAAIQ